MKRSREERQLRAALAPFAALAASVPNNADAVWVYAGRRDSYGEPPHLTPDDFRKAAIVLNVPRCKRPPGLFGGEPQSHDSESNP